MKKLIVLVILLVAGIAVAQNPFTDTPNPYAGFGFGGKGSPYGGGSQIAYDFRDEFSDTLAAGAVHETYSTSGHQRNVVDTEEKITISGGNLVFAGGKASPAYGDPGILWNASAGFARAAGQMFIQDLTITDVTAGLEFGFDANTSGVLGASAARIVSDTYLPYETGTGLGSIATPADATNYKVAVINRSAANTGAFHLLKTTTGSWKLIGRTQSNNTATVYPANANYSAAFTSSFIRVPSLRFLPQPLISMGFD